LSLPPSWRTQARASEARRPGSTPGGGAAVARVVERTRAAFNANTLGKENAWLTRDYFRGPARLRRQIRSTRQWDAPNAFPPEHALAQYAATGTFYGTFYANEKEQLDKVLELASKVAPEFVAKTAVFARERGYMKTCRHSWLRTLQRRTYGFSPASSRASSTAERCCGNFVQIVRSGVVGRKSFGTAPKRLAQGWFKSRSPEAIFRQSLGGEPSMKDVIKMVRPSPKNEKGEVDKVREALYGYLIGKDVAIDILPPNVRAFEAFKKGEGKVPDVPFEMLTALELSTSTGRRSRRRWAGRRLG